MHHQGPNSYKKYQTYLLQGAAPVSHGGKSTDLGAQKHDVASLGVREEATRYTGRCLSVATREVIKTRSEQGTTHASWGFRQNDGGVENSSFRPKVVDLHYMKQRAGSAGML